MGPRAAGALAAATLVLASAGCGDGGSIERVAGAPGAAPVGGALTYALGRRPNRLDPLRSSTRAEQIATRQIHEPLVERLRDPFDRRRAARGLARSWGSSRDRVIWRFELRDRVRFQDGTPFDSRAVVANAERWRTLPVGRKLLPELVAADAPRPGLVRFVLSRGVRHFPRRLASPRLGIVSPQALRPRTGRGSSVARDARTGTGPFELRERSAGRILLARNVEWWGARLRLGPALDQVELRAAHRPSDRVALLKAGTAQLADSLPPAAIPRLRNDPLLTYVGGPGSEVLGMERSVRGVRSATAIEPLSEVWLTTIATD